MTTPTVTSSTDSQMHNNIMAAGLRDHPPMLAIGQYPQWRSLFLRYIDTRPNGEALRKCILNGHYKPTTVLVQAIAATDDSPAIPEHTTEMWKAIERLQQGESLNIQDVKTNLFWEFAQRDKDMQKNLALIAKYFKKIYKPTKNNLRTSSNSRNKNMDTTPRYKNDNQSGQFRNQRTMNVTGARENEVPTADTCTDSEPLKKDMEILIQTYLMHLALKTQNDSFIFVHELKQEMHADLKTTQTRATQSPQIVRNINPHVSTSTGVNHKTNVSRPQYRSNQLKDKVLPNNSKVKPKKTQVEEHPMISSISNKTKYIVQLILLIVDSGCTKHMTGNLKLLCNFVEKFLGNVRLGNDQFTPILGYGDLVQGNIMINRVYYIEGLNHNLFSVGQFCDADLEVAIRKSTCFVRDLQGNDLLIDNYGSDLYTISFQESTSSTPLCLMAKASPTQAWLWHRRLSYLNFDYINLLSKKHIVIGLPKLKFVKDQLCSSCELSKAKRSSVKSKVVLSLKGRLNLLHMDLCGPIRVASINGKKYILVIIDDYSRYTWTLFLRSKDETPEVLKEFLTMIQRNLQALVITVRTERGTQFLNKTLNAFLKKKELSIKLLLLEHLNRTTLSKDETVLWLRLLERCSQL
nr:retrovirus-related Pol polyprotein from transposon TNT 1-94 [Tanacetum cinerariifolium]